MLKSKEVFDKATKVLFYHLKFSKKLLIN